MGNDVSSMTATLETDLVFNFLPSFPIKLNNEKQMCGSDSLFNKFLSVGTLPHSLSLPLHSPVFLHSISLKVLSSPFLLLFVSHSIYFCSKGSAFTALRYFTQNVEALKSLCSTVISPCSPAYICARPS